MKIDSRKKIRDVAGEHILIMQGHEDTDMTRVVALNETALHLYNLLLGREFGIEDVTRTILDEYDIDETTARRDAADWIFNMKKEGLIID